MSIALTESFVEKQGVGLSSVLSKKTKTVNSDCKQFRYLEVFLLYPYINKRVKKIDLNYFFDSDFFDTIKQFAGQQVFLTQQSALQYSRFMGNHYGILRVYLPEVAIEGRSYGLVLKKGFVTPTNIFECLFKSDEGITRFKNPHFDDTYRV